MTGPAHSYWFYCWDCLWKEIRHSNTKVCPGCGKRTLTRLQKATREEFDAKFNELMRKWKAIPE